MEKLDGQVVLVTGAGNGIGRATAELFADEGARVVLVDLSEAAAQSVAQELVLKGQDAIAIAADVRARTDLEAGVAAAVSRWGRLDVLVANAGIYPLCDLESIDDDAWDNVMDVNARGALHAVQAVLGPMTQRGYGRIVLMSSITGPITGYPGHAHYGASKAAMLGMMRSAALELAERGVTINAVMPGNIATEGVRDVGEDHAATMLASIPMRRIGDPIDVAWAVRFLASPEARYITGQTLVIDGGQVLPEAATL